MLRHGYIHFFFRSHHGCNRDRMVVGFIATCTVHCTCAISDLRQVGSPGTPVSSTNKTDNHNIPEILLKVALKTINQKLNLIILFSRVTA